MRDIVTKGNNTALLEVMESTNETWMGYLRKTYKEAPEAKCVKFSDIQDGLQAQFPSALVSSASSSQLIQDAFPNSSSKRLGKDRRTCILGIEPFMTESDSMNSSISTPSSPSPVLEKSLQEENEQLSKRVEELEAKVRKLEDEKSRNSLAVELDTLLHHGTYALHGPDSTVNFSSSSDHTTHP